MTPEESTLAAATEVRLKRNEAIVEDLRRRLAQGETIDFTAERIHLLGEMGPTNADLAKLTDIQVREAASEYGRAEVTASWLPYLFATAFVLAAVAAGYGLFVVLNRVTRPIEATTMSQLAAGGLDAPVTGVGRQDEIGDMAKAVQIFKDALVAKRHADAAAAAEKAVKVRRAEMLDRTAETITGQVAVIQGEIHRAGDAIPAIATTVLDLRTIAVGVAASIEEEGAVTQEIVRNVTEAGNGTRAVTVNIAAVTEASGQTGNAATLVLAAATQLSRQSDDLGAAVADFLETVRAA